MYVLLVDGHLVAAAAERHFQCLTGMQFAFRRRYARAADADGDRGRHVILTLHARTLSKTAKRFVLASSMCWSSVMSIITPVRHAAQKASMVSIAQLRRTDSTSDVMRESSLPEASRVSSSRLSNEITAMTVRFSR